MQGSFPGRPPEPAETQVWEMGYLFGITLSFSLLFSSLQASAERLLSPELPEPGLELGSVPQEGIHSPLFIQMTVPPVELDRWASRSGSPYTGFLGSPNYR